MGGSGAALFDANGDGRLDVYLLQGGSVAEELPQAVNRLFLQNQDGQFQDVTADCGANHSGYGQGCAVGDLNNDGHLDLYVTNVAEDVLFQGRGDGTFEDITVPAGIDNPLWGTSVTLLDFDADGFLDIFVANYVTWNHDSQKDCRGYSSRVDYCGPSAYPPAADVLYRNRGDGTYEDVSNRSGIRSIPRRGLGVIAADLDQDGWTDLYVANDGEENHLWINRQGKHFEDLALVAGTALNSAGKPEASMGIAVGDVDGDLRLDLFMTHLRRETNTLYRNLGDHHFLDDTARYGLSGPSLAFTGFGTLLLDYDHDGVLDLALVNGRVVRGDSLGASGAPFWQDYCEPNRLYRGTRKGRFEPVGSQEPFSTALEVSRGLLTGDLDEDGDLDLLVTNIQAPPQLYRNEAEKQGHWLKVRAFDPALQRLVYGAQVLVQVGGEWLLREVNSVSSYLSSNDARAHFGLGDASRYDALRVRWPGGKVESFPGGPADCEVTIERDQGTTDAP
jgi:hypothetical protein